jgi:hypothetical protein
MTATKQLQDANDRFQAACKSGNSSLIEASTQALVAAQLEFDAAIIDAKSRERVADGGRRRDRVLSIEQEEQRQALFETLQLEPKDTQTPSIKGNKVTIDAGAAYRQVLDLWATACNTMGNSTVGRWMLISAIHRAGPPPGWKGAWPPDMDGE